MRPGEATPLTAHSIGGDVRLILIESGAPVKRQLADGRLANRLRRIANYPRLRVGLVWRTVRPKAPAMNNPG